MSFTIFQNFLGLKKKKFKGKKKIDFPTGLTHSFGPKMAIVPTFFFLGYIGQENVFYHIPACKESTVR